MKIPKFGSLDAPAGILFLAIGSGGVLFGGWGELRIAFLLLIYFLLLIGFRLDEIGRRLASIDRRLAGRSRPKPSESGDLQSSSTDRPRPPAAGNSR